MHRMNHDSPFAALGNTRDTAEVEAQVAAIVGSFAPGHDLTRVGGAFDLLDRAFDGRLSGYQKLKTLYHNRAHTNEVVLCTPRACCTACTWPAMAWTATTLMRR
jgi:hypothetical protein